jgi:hypothetical protein
LSLGPAKQTKARPKLRVCGTAYAAGTSKMRTLLYIFAICLAALILFVTVDRVEHDRPLATLLMILILGIVAAAVLIKVMP